MASLKGTTIIELTDVKTGEVETIEKNNIIGPIINYMMNLPTIFSEGFDLHRGLQPLHQKTFGGLYLFDDTVPETSTMFPSHALVTGAGAYDYTNINSTVIGTYNKAESSVSETTIKHVWDFATSQANGTIASICLGESDFIKYAYFGCDYTKLSDSTSFSFTSLSEANCNNGDWLFPYGAGTTTSNFQDHVNTRFNGTIGVLCGAHIPASNTHAIGSSRDQGTYDSKKNGCVFYTNDLKEQWLIYKKSGYTYTIERLNLSTTLDTFQEQKVEALYYIDYNIGNRGVTSIKRPKPRTIETKDFTFVGTGSYVNSWYDASTQKLYVICAGNANTLAVNASVTLNVLDFSNATTLAGVTQTTVSFTNKTSDTLTMLSANADATLYAGNTSTAQQHNQRFAVVNGYLFACGTNCFYKIKVTDSTDITVISNPLITPFSPSSSLNTFSHDENGLLYTRAQGDNVNDVVINTKRNTVNMCRGIAKIVRPSLNLGPDSQFSLAIPIPTKTYSPLKLACCVLGQSTTSSEAYQIFASLPPRPIMHKSYPSTINNLQTPVVKTSDKTMKVTYILEKV